MRNDKLRGVFEALGFEAVASVLSSGNIVFTSAETDAPALEAAIQDAARRAGHCRWNHHPQPG